MDYCAVTTSLATSVINPKSVDDPEGVCAGNRARALTIGGS